MKRVAIQGGVGAYHEIAAREYFKGEELELCLAAHLRIYLLRQKKIRIL